MFNPARPAPFVLVSTDHGMLIVNHQDYEACEGGGAIGVSVEIFNHSQYDAAQLELLLQIMDMRHQHTGDGVVVLDGGANIGAYTCAFATAMSGWGSVVAFEPQELIYYALCGNIVLNNCLNARALRAGLGAHNGVAQVPLLDYTRSRNYGGVSLMGDHTGPTQDVPLQCIDGFAFPRVDMIKLDIEGMEIEALRGARETIQRCKPLMCIEHIFCGVDAIKQVLEPWGYAVQMTGMNALCVHKDDPVSKRIKYYDSKAA
jgi:FkbM family methyltransferase